MVTMPFIFTREALRQLDRRAVEEFHLPIVVLMENAGRAVAEAALKLLRSAVRAPSAQASGNPHVPAVLVLAGPGNNGGDGLVAARHLHNAGVEVTVLLLAPREKYREATAEQLAIVDRMKLTVETLSPDHSELRDWLVEASPEDLIIDGIFGTGLSRPPEGLAADVIRAANGSGHPILAIDIPSGMDCDSGGPIGNSSAETVIRAVQTVSFCGNKVGYTNSASKTFTGRVVATDIGVPLELLRALAISPALPSRQA